MYLSLVIISSLLPFFFFGTSLLPNIPIKDQYSYSLHVLTEFISKSISKKKLYNFKYRVFLEQDSYPSSCSKKNFKISNLEFWVVKLHIWNFTTQNSKFEVSSFICILVIINNYTSHLWFLSIFSFIVLINIYNFCIF